MNDSRELYEDFHDKTRFLKKIPKPTDFGMVHHLPIYSRYIKSGMSVLDVGCGAGPMSLFAASCGAIVKGVDLSEKAIDENNKTVEFHGLDNLRFVCENFMAYEDDEQYDAIMMTEVLEHLEDDAAALAKVYRLLRPSGHLLMSVPSLNAPLHKRYLRKYGKDPFDEQVGHLRRYTAADIFNRIFVAGFRLVEFKLCEGLLRNWLYNDSLGQFFMKCNIGPVKQLVTFVDDQLFTPMMGESDIILVARKK